MTALTAAVPSAAVMSQPATEQAALGAALRDVEAFDVLAQTLTDEDFTDPACAIIYRAMTWMHDAGRPVDTVTLAAVLDRSRQWRAGEFGDALGFVAALDECSATFGAVASYVEAIRSMSASRALVASARKIEAVAGKPLDADEKFAEAASVITDLSASARIVDSVSAADAAIEALAEMERTRERGGMSGQSTGFRDLDAITSGLQSSELTILAARPSCGKSALGFNIATHVARTAPVHVFSLEMPASSIGQRMLSALGDVNLDSVRSGKLDHVEETGLAAAAMQIKQLDMRIDDHPGLSIDQIRARARMAARKKPPGLIVIDFLTLIAGGQGESKAQQVGSNAVALKGLAKELDCAVLCLAQLNRQCELRPDKRPIKADLKESGSIEEAADLILFNYLDEQYNEDSSRAGILELIVAKQRNGRTGTVFLEWIGKHQKFRDMERAVPPLVAKEPMGGGARLRSLAGGKSAGFDGLPT